LGINLAFYKLLARISRMPRMLYFSPVEGSQGIGNLANPFLNLTVFIRVIRAKKK
jgi:hypothetical protein